MCYINLQNLHFTYFRGCPVTAERVQTATARLTCVLERVEKVRTTNFRPQVSRCVEWSRFHDISTAETV